MAKHKRVERARQRAQKRKLFMGGIAVLGVVLAVGAAWVLSRPPAAEGFYREVTPAQAAEAISSGEPTLVYFHSPT